MPNYQGKFIVIDGTDGSGKGTQTKMLVDKLNYAGFLVEMADFPQYGKKSAGAVEEYLNGRYGHAREVGPYRASILYAIDRYDASFQIREWLSQGKIVISNRYTSSNMAHQGGKIKNNEERRRYFKWLHDLEFELFAIPKPDLNVILHVDAEVAQKLVDQKGKRDYIGGAKRDIHEADIEHLRDAERVYLEMAETFTDFDIIRCAKNGKIMSREEINYKLWLKIAELINYHGNSPLDIHYNHLSNIHSHLPPPKSKKTINKNKLTIQRINSRAKIPTRAYEGDAGYDLYSSEYHSINPGAQVNIKTGIKMAIPANTAGIIADKSGVALAGIHTMGGVIDAGFRGEVSVNLINLGQDIYHISPGQKIAQLILKLIATPDIHEMELEDDTERGTGEYGSSGLF